MTRARDLSSVSLVSSPFVKDTWASSQWRKVRREVLRREVVMSHWVDRQWSTSLRPKRLPWAESQLPLTCFNVPPHWPEPPALATCPPLPPLNCGVSPPTELTTLRSIRHPGRSTPAFSRWIWTCWPLASLGSGTGEGGATEPLSVGPPTLRNSTETIPYLRLCRLALASHTCFS